LLPCVLVTPVKLVPAVKELELEIPPFVEYQQNPGFASV